MTIKNSMRIKKIWLLFWGMFGSLIGIILGFFVLVWWNIHVAYADDLLMKAFRPTLERDMIIDLGETKTSVGHSMTRSQTSAKASWDKGINIDVSKKPPLLVRVAKILLRLTILLSVTMIIYNAVVYAMKVMWWESYFSKASLQQLALVLWGVILALLSIALINLMRSVGTTTFKTVFGL